MADEKRRDAPVPGHAIEFVARKIGVSPKTGTI